MIDQKTLLSPGLLALAAGVAMPAKTLVQFSPFNTLYPVACSDWATTANGNTAILAAGSAGGVAISEPQNAGNPQTVAKAPDGSVYYLTIASGNASAQIIKYGTTGSQTATTTALTYAAAGTTIGGKLAILSNGNVAAVWEDQSGGSLYYAVFDKNLNTVKASTLIATTSQSGTNCTAAALGAGGFVIVYHDGSNKVTKITKYDNTGTVTVAAVTTRTWVGSVTGGMDIAAAELPNGNIAVAYVPVYTTDLGLWIGVMSSALSTVLAPTQRTTTATNFNRASIAVATTTFAVAYDNIKSVYVCDLTGALVGTHTVSTVVTGNFSKVVTDGTSYYYVYLGASNFLYLDKLDQTAAIVGVPAATVSSLANNNSAGMDVAYGDGMVAAIKSQYPTLTNQSCVVFDVASVPSQPAVLLTTSIGHTNTGTATQGLAILYLGDWAFCYFHNGDSPNVWRGIQKLGNSAIMGVTSFTVAAGAMCQFSGGLVYSAISNTVIGTQFKTFDHTAATIPGTKGQLMGTCAKLNGF